ncbi:MULTISPECIES: hypothetical protein [unclassified Mesorhizobium]|uniref:hypothetical protein n=1 Tax=unclassified Mesorhizobium TaxID=325217 RepID=UPI000FC9F927|nr:MULTISPECIES: hypothetical protein [unclassified Mesorhizobium]RUW01452.1 hypothetical protein EOA49_10950 [Mesorhizobium sp. M1A.F.Ca.IN.020.04.1.1]RUW07294.1 hypothetical protein EOA53_21410 [Mesorhizobium sp. M1A.F.Ca.IN.020.03.1.1]RWF70818.1 MAG: hypothetical protein EOQ34_17400 [Mesorhizobium sp.]RWG10526.1 MAG: hypothetical protein EOQ58_26685 [Mesorhizobium sp.]RWG25392.1 MAG: hypothetical protein EOQ61_29080 [Mesorhizobium sp.]
MLFTKHLIGGQGREKPMLASLWRDIFTAQTPRGVDTSCDRFWWAAGMTSMAEIRRKAAELVPFAVTQICDLVLIASDLNSVLKALRESGIESRPCTISPTTNPGCSPLISGRMTIVGKLAKGLNLALDQVHLKTGS